MSYALTDGDPGALRHTGTTGTAGRPAAVPSKSPGCTPLKPQGHVTEATGAVRHFCPQHRRVPPTPRAPPE
ncbi:protein of unknown function [Streptomyces murinus]